MCGESTLRAARNRAGKKKNLDETGLEILGCRHTVAQAAINMFQREIYSYAHYLRNMFSPEIIHSSYGMM